MLEIAEIFTAEEFEELQKQAGEIYSERERYRKEKEIASRHVKELVHAILDSFKSVNLYDKLLKELEICIKNGVTVKIKVENKMQKDIAMDSGITKKLEEKVNDIISESWNESVWYSVKDVFEKLPNFYGSYSSINGTHTLTVKFKD